MTKRYLSAKEVAELLGIAESTAYAVIREWNKELKSEGYFTKAGSIPRAYFEKKYSMKELSDADLWYMEIKQTIDLRNGLVHPKSVVQVTYTQIEKALWSVLNTVNVLYLAVYKRKVPIYNYGIQAKVLGE